VRSELVQTDWGTAVQRRNSREPVDKGGWSIVHSWGSTTAIANPVSQFYMRGVGGAGWPGWFADEEIEHLTEQWLLARPGAEQAAIADRLQARAFERLPSVPLGQFHIRSAVSRTLEGQIEATGVYPWNVRRV
jgi:peptide/nickel transport system substrate-binding protein